jgi:hypothetical protein
MQVDEAKNVGEEWLSENNQSTALSPRPSLKVSPPMNKRLSIFVALVAVIAVAAGCYKITGGGRLNVQWQTYSYNYQTGVYIYDYGYEDVTIGFNAQTTGPDNPSGDPEYTDAKGQFQLIDQANKIKIHADFDLSYNVDEWSGYGYHFGDDDVEYRGTATVKSGKDKDDSWEAWFQVQDGQFYFQAWKYDWPVDRGYYYSASTAGANFTIHK